ncbi:MAG: RbsD/FucU domain-containing protein [Christensenellales bacterium]
MVASVGTVKPKPNIPRNKYLSIFGYGALPHRPTKGLSERLRRPFGASPFGNLRAKRPLVLFLKYAWVSLRLTTPGKWSWRLLYAGKVASPIISPEPLKIIAEMQGHGDELCSGRRANFPGTSIGQRVRAAATAFSRWHAEVMRALLALFPLDDFVQAPLAPAHVTVMRVPSGGGGACSPATKRRSGRRSARRRIPTCPPPNSI